MSNVFARNWPMMTSHVDTIKGERKRSNQTVGRSGENGDNAH